MYAEESARTQSTSLHFLFHKKSINRGGVGDDGKDLSLSLAVTQFIYHAFLIWTKLSKISNFPQSSQSSMLAHNSRNYYSSLD